MKKILVNSKQRERIKILENSIVKAQERINSKKKLLEKYKKQMLNPKILEKNTLKCTFEYPITDTAGHYLDDPVMVTLEFGNESLSVNSLKDRDHKKLRKKLLDFFMRHKDMIDDIEFVEETSDFSGIYDDPILVILNRRRISGSQVEDFPDRIDSLVFA